jgi:DNA-binding NarL/FixJ family response regulator
MIRLMIVEDLPAVRTALRMRLNAEDDLSVVGAAENGEAALALAPSLLPDVMLLDVEMPSMDGITAASALHRLCPKAAIVILSFQDDALTRSRAAAAGAVAFVAKSSPTELLLAAIRRAAQGPLKTPESPLPPDLPQ